MLAISIKSFSDNEGVAISDHIEKRIAGEISSVSTRATHMQIRHGVYFKNRQYPHLFMEFSSKLGWRDTAEGCVIREWLDGNISGKFSVQTSYVFFEDYDDALLCYLRYRG